MTAPAAIVASLVDVRNLNTEKSVKLTLHVPAEQAGMVFEAFGWPTATNPVPVALARLHIPAEPIAKPEAPKERRPFSELPYSQQAAMRCREADFHKYCESTAPTVWADLIRRGSTHDDAAAGLVRNWCMVASRTDITKGRHSGDCWEAIEAEYYAWQRGMR